MQQWLLLGMLMVVASCSHIPSIDERRDLAQSLVMLAGWKVDSIETDRFSLWSAYSIKQEASKHLTIYIEGDGLAWQSRSEVSLDPTPLNPLALKLALQHTAGNAAYLARPCQLSINKRNCDHSYWTDARYAPEVIAAHMQTVDYLKEYFSAESITLVGYSGGGVVAALVAAQRDDVTQLVTVAANLDQQKWTEVHNLSPLTASLNPVDFAESLSNVSQRHYVGDEDTVVPKDIVVSYMAKLQSGATPELVVIPGFDHHCCWVKSWPELLEEANIGSGRHN